MPVTDVSHDLDARSLTIVAEFHCPPKRIWEIYADPRQLEQIWGPPTHPATFVDHNLVPGGRMNYYMTSPEGERYYGYWEVETVNEPSGFTFDDGFALDDQFTKNPDLPVGKNVFSFAERDGGTRAIFVSTYATAEALQKVLDMGVVEGASSAINQIDGLVAA